MTVKEKTMRIMELALEISPPDVSYEYENKPVVFVRYSGHCPCMSVEIYSDGWDREERDKPTHRINVFDMSSEEASERLDEIIKLLEEHRGNAQCQSK